jgi:hypothetical protein
MAEDVEGWDEVALAMTGIGGAGAFTDGKGQLAVLVAEDVEGRDDVAKALAMTGIGGGAGAFTDGKDQLAVLEVCGGA